MIPTRSQATEVQVLRIRAQKANSHAWCVAGCFIQLCANEAEASALVVLLDVCADLIEVDVLGVPISMPLQLPEIGQLDRAGMTVLESDVNRWAVTGDHDTSKVVRKGRRWPRPHWLIDSLSWNCLIFFWPGVGPTPIADARNFGCATAGVGPQPVQVARLPGSFERGVISAVMRLQEIAIKRV